MEKNQKFEDWFHALQGWSLASEIFYSDLDAIFYYKSLGHEDLTKKAEKHIVNWLQSAYEAGVEDGKKENNN
jgi:hypothetical protein